MYEKKNILLSDAVAQIVSQFAARESATVEDVVALAQQLPAALNNSAKLPAAVAAPVAETPEHYARPAVDIDQSVSDEAVTCLCCGRSFTMLKRHLKAEHGLSESQYRAQFGLDDSHPLVAPNYSSRKAEYAKRIGLGKYARDDAMPSGSRPNA